MRACSRRCSGHAMAIMKKAKASGANTNSAAESAQATSTTVHTPSIATSVRLVCGTGKGSGAVTQKSVTFWLVAVKAL